MFQLHQSSISRKLSTQLPSRANTLVNFSCCSIALSPVESDFWRSRLKRSRNPECVSTVRGSSPSSSRRHSSECHRLPATHETRLEVVFIDVDLVSVTYFWILTIFFSSTEKLFLDFCPKFGPFWAPQWQNIIQLNLSSSICSAWGSIYCEGAGFVPLPKIINLGFSCRVCRFSALNFILATNLTSSEWHIKMIPHLQLILSWNCIVWW